ncbi:hypothetical protein C8Q80DRAFT_1113393 [Daedaleopsis nitida]|nr:hypothetical protein C8Q80DRAFT_1113393 [Daedaleopsis nitida]
MLLKHPKKGSDEIQPWITNVLLPRINACRDDPDTVYLFTDGSALPLYGQSSAGFHAYCGDHRIHSRMAATGCTLSYDAELIAIVMALKYASSLNAATVHLFSDGLSALQTVFEPGIHAGQSVSLSACRAMREWLDSDARRRIIFSHCPSHSGVRLNENIDYDVSVASNDPNLLAPRPYPHTWTYQRADITNAARDGWTATSNAHGYRGRRFPRNRALRTTTHTGTFPLKHVGDSPSLCARTVRCFTDHAPTGAYRMRFFPDQPTDCSCDRRELQTRRHIVDRCTHYVRNAYSLKWDSFLDSLDPFPLIISFLQSNPTAFTFEDAPPTFE